MPFYHYQVQDQINVYDFLKEKFQLNEDAISNLIHLGCLYLNGTRWFPNRYDVLLPNQIIRFHPTPKRFSVEQLKKLKVIEEDKNFIAIYKPPGVPSHETLDNRIENAKFYLMQKNDFNNLWPLFRLDVGTQGILLFAKNRDFANHYNELLKTRKITKIYHALSSGPTSLAAGLYKHWMIKNKKAPKVILPKAHMTEMPPYELLECQLQLISSERFDPGLIRNFDVNDHTSIFLNKIQLITGRTHQIRAQMSTLSHPLIGDSLYGSSIQSKCPFECFALACTQIMIQDVGINVRLEFGEVNW
jgi:23S rRNA-/tRNA-specific pseudouridylate synthase